MIEGITATVVRDTVYVDGELAEDTYDWYAQDKDGNVWYLGEDTHEYEDGEAVNAKGAWEYGKDGALPGIVMLADPEVGDAYRQEYYEGEAEDMGEVLEVGVTTEIALGLLRRRRRHRGLEPARARGRRGEVLRPRGRPHPRGEDGRRRRARSSSSSSRRPAERPVR